MPYRDSPHHEIEILMSFNNLNLFKQSEHIEDHHIRKPNDKKFQFEVEDKNYIYVVEKIFSFKKD